MEENGDDEDNSDESKGKQWRRWRQQRREHARETDGMIMRTRLDGTELYSPSYNRDIYMILHYSEKEVSAKRQRKKSCDTQETHASNEGRETICGTTGG